MTSKMNSNPKHTTVYYASCILSFFILKQIPFIND